MKHTGAVVISREDVNDDEELIEHMAHQTRILAVTEAAAGAVGAKSRTGRDRDTREGIGWKQQLLIGAGSAMFTIGVVSDLLKSGEPVELALVDTDPAALEVAQKLVEKMVAARKKPVRLVASTAPRQVLKGASVVITCVPDNTVTVSL